ncbi:MAG: PD-(D/E)XK nuclease family protein, partial [Melioribacteraceae bacterium]|nr:PD-(D/E)XK nuclease family protein [Melioribacteraceae bacterium]
FDYKTDSLLKSSPQEKLENYRAQLTFYALLISKLFDNIKQIKCSLIFIENPKEVPTFTIDVNALKNIEQELNEIVNSIRHEKFKTKTSHCKSCYFSDSKNECVVKH